MKYAKKIKKSFKYLKTSTLYFAYFLHKIIICNKKYLNA